MANTPDLRTAIMNKAAGRPHAPPPDEPAGRPGRQASRVGKVSINAHFPKPVRDQLKLIALERGTTLQGVLGEAINDLFAKHGRPELADPE